MGMLPGWGRTCSSDARGAAPNPDPSRYEIIQRVEEGIFTILLVRYLDCTNYDGKKILVYRGMAGRCLNGTQRLDPHFAERGASPIARFIPTSEGWHMAKLFCLVAQPQEG